MNETVHVFVRSTTDIEEGNFRWVRSLHEKSQWYRDDVDAFGDHMFTIFGIFPSELLWFRLSGPQLYMRVVGKVSFCSIKLICVF